MLLERSGLRDTFHVNIFYAQRNPLLSSLTGPRPEAEAERAPTRPVPATAEAKPRPRRDAHPEPNLKLKLSPNSKRNVCKCK